MTRLACSSHMPVPAEPSGIIVSTRCPPRQVFFFREHPRPPVGRVRLPIAFRLLGREAALGRGVTPPQPSALARPCGCSIAAFPALADFSAPMGENSRAPLPLGLIYIAPSRAAGLLLSRLFGLPDAHTLHRALSSSPARVAAPSFFCYNEMGGRVPFRRAAPLALGPRHCFRARRAASALLLRAPPDANF